jgi:hypothetical protein
MEWNRTDTLPIADHQCSVCHGLGLRGGRLDAIEPCNCVLRAIFRACFQRFQVCATKEKSLSKVTLDGASTRSRRAVWGRKDEEFIADFMLVAKRTLNPGEHQLFRFHFLLSADWRLCCKRLSLDKGVFFHAVYRIEQKLGRVFRELQPYPLYPVDEYFNGVTLEHRALRTSIQNSIAIRPPLVRAPRIDLPGTKAA